MGDIIKLTRKHDINRQIDHSDVMSIGGRIPRVKHDNMFGGDAGSSAEERNGTKDHCVPKGLPGAVEPAMGGSHQAVGAE